MASFNVRKAKSGQFYFVLKAGNGEIVAQSEMYTTKAAAVNGTDAVRRAAAAAEGYVDETEEK